MRGGRRASFVVRVVEEGAGRVSGVVERVATGAKEPFESLAVVGSLIERMLRRQDVLPPVSVPAPACEPEPGPAARGPGQYPPTPGEGSGVR
jgi:hypothetical protein